MNSSARNWILVVLVLLILGGGYFYLQMKQTAQLDEPLPVVEETAGPEYKVIGTSVEGRKIEAYTYGTGAKHVLFVGGIHGGYEWNTVMLAYRFLDYFNANPTAIPSYLTVTIVPVLNPDGLFKVVGKEGRFALADVPADDALQVAGRFNAHTIDLNRNFDCEWQPESTWRGNVMSAGTAPFSEPEAVAFRDFIQANKFESVIWWHSQANTVYASHCDGNTLPETLVVMKTYGEAAGYNTSASFSAYPVTGDAEGWLAKIGVPSITVELKTHETVEWEQNLAGVKALFAYYSQ